MSTDYPLHQKGANGLLAEYHCARRLAQRLSTAGIEVRPTVDQLLQQAETQVGRYSGELTPAQLARAENQGEALGDYIADRLSVMPADLGLPADFPEADYRFDVLTTGHDTGKPSSADVEIVMHPRTGGPPTRLPVSLKAYAGSTTSLGSKGAVASLTRLFFGKAKASEAEFVREFGDNGRQLIALLADFKAVAKEFRFFAVFSG